MGIALGVFAPLSIHAARVMLTTIVKTCRDWMFSFAKKSTRTSCVHVSESYFKLLRHKVLEILLGHRLPLDVFLFIVLGRLWPNELLPDASLRKVLRDHIFLHMWILDARSESWCEH